MRSARVHAQAKINLVLRIGGRESDGYHKLVTIFQRIDLADEVTVRVGGLTRSVDCTGPALPSQGVGPAERNLGYRAALAYAERAPWLRGFAVEIVKHIPVGGGLGGGSADAGGVLRALEALAPEPLGSSALLDIARGLGADVPFLASEHTVAVGTGYGERLHPLGALPSRPIALAVPQLAVLTADAYRWLDEAGAGSFLPSAGEMSQTGISDVDSWERVAKVTANDFEAVLEPRFPELARLRAWLIEAGARFARLSGSGSAIFGLFDDPPPRLPESRPGARIQMNRTAERVVQVEVQE